LVLAASFQMRIADLDAGAGEAVDASAAEPVAGTFEGEDVGVVDDPVDHRGGNGLVSEDAAPT